MWLDWIALKKRRAIWAVVARETWVGMPPPVIWAAMIAMVTWVSLSLWMVTWDVVVVVVVVVSLGSERLVTLVIWPWIVTVIWLSRLVPPS